jgi:hypothetical protein
MTRSPTIPKSGARIFDMARFYFWRRCFEPVFRFQNCVAFVFHTASLSGIFRSAPLTGWHGG